MLSTAIAAEAQAGRENKANNKSILYMGDSMKLTVWQLTHTLNVFKGRCLRALYDLTRIEYFTILTSDKEKFGEYTLWLKLASISIITNRV